jgi:hypothetical protein
MGFLEFDDTTFTNALTIEEQQLQEFELYVNRLRNGEWADNLAVQGVVDMLNVNIRVINTITPNWIHQIQPRQQTTDNTITLGQMGELHYVALENVEEMTRNESRFEEATNQIEDEEDIIAYEQTSKLRGIPYDTLLQDEQQLVNDDSTYSIAPGENQTPCAFLMVNNLRSWLTLLNILMAVAAYQQKDREKSQPENILIRGYYTKMANSPVILITSWLHSIQLKQNKFGMICK